MKASLLNTFKQPLSWLAIVVLVWASLVALLNKSPFQNDLTLFFPDQQSIEAEYLKNRLSPNQNTSWLMLSIPINQSSHNTSDFSQQAKIALLELNGIKQVLNGSEPLQSPLQQSTEPDLYPYRYLLNDFELSQLTPQIQQRWEEYQLGLVLDKKWLLDDPTFQWVNFQNQLKTKTQLPKQNGVWFHAETASVLLLIETEKQAQILVNLNQRLETLLGKEHFKLSGIDWISLQAEQEIKAAVNLITALAIGMVILALFIAFRSAKLILISSLPLLGAFAVGTLTTITLFGNMQLITLALGAILLGVAIDYPIHTISAYRSRKPSVIDKIWPTIRLGALTSAFGFLMLWWISIEGLQQMAIFASAGLLTALLITKSLKPTVAKHYVIDASPIDESPIGKSTSMEMDSFPLNTVPKTIVYLMTGLLIIACILWIKPIQWQDDIASLSPVSNNLIQTDRQLRSQFQYKEVGKQLLLPAKDMESLLQKEEALIVHLDQLKKVGAITQYQLLSKILPSQSLQKERQLSLPSSTQLQTELTQAVSGSRFQAKHFQSFMDSMTQSKQLPLMHYDDFIQSNDPSIDLASQLVTHTNQQVIGVITLAGVESNQAIQHFVKQHKPLGLIYFNQRAFVAEQIAEIRKGLYQSLIFIMLALAIIIAIKFRNLHKVLTVLGPIMLAIGFTLATLTLLNISLSIFHLMSLMLVAAIGIDYSLLFAQGAEQKTDSKAWTHAIRVAFFTTLGSFGILSLSQLTLLSAIGLTVLIGVLWVYLLAAFVHQKSVVRS